MNSDNFSYTDDDDDDDDDDMITENIISASACNPRESV